MTQDASNVLVINSGSSSLKYELFSMSPERSLAEGMVERIGESEPFLWQVVRCPTQDGASAQASPDDSDFDADAPTGRPVPSVAGAIAAATCDERIESHADAPDHTHALSAAFEALSSADLLSEACELAAVGHRIVHGGSDFFEPTRLDDDIIARIRELALLAPLHTNANLAGVRAAFDYCPDVPQIAVFDTAFHQTMPREACEYALPQHLTAAHGIRRYGFHGTSHAYVARRAARMLGAPLNEVNLITMHLGNGASATAIRGGESVDTSMGMTPLEGLVMGTRCGDIDPAIPMLISELTGLDRGEVDRILNHESGLLGLSGSNDMREIMRLAEEGDEMAELAVAMFCHRAKKYLGAYYAVLGQVDAIVFTGGIGENRSAIRARICEGLAALGIRIDAARNDSARGSAREISATGSRVKVLVIPTDEELEIARQAYELVGGGAEEESET
jgi:acetate kinase